MTISGAVLKPNSSAPNKAAVTTSNPVRICPSACKTTLNVRIACRKQEIRKEYIRQQFNRSVIMNDEKKWITNVYRTQRISRTTHTT